MALILSMSILRSSWPAARAEGGGDDDDGDYDYAPAA